ncbi:MAG: Ig-like domain-containing protein [Gemmatimonadota bacterium]|nr:Ig-like domain-containing protein [Gemmatimonadota bacterium]
MIPFDRHTRATGGPFHGTLRIKSVARAKLIDMGRKLLEGFGAGRRTAARRFAALHPHRGTGGIPWIAMFLLSSCEPPQATTVTITPASATLTALEAGILLTAGVQDQRGETMPGVHVAWVSSDESVVTVREGLVTAKGNGAATVTASTGSLAASALVTVDQVVTDLSLSPTLHMIEAIEDTVRIEAEGSDANGHPVPDAEFLWSSSDESVATVDSAGLVTAMAHGGAWIAAAADAVEEKAAVRVSQTPRTVTVSLPADTVIEGRLMRATAHATDANGHPIPWSPLFWSSSDTSVARIFGRGTVHAVGIGRAAIIADYGPVEGQSEITVVANPDRAALVALYEATGGPHWTERHNWLSDVPLDRWTGVSTDGSGRVVRIELVRNNLKGPLPPELGNLTDLQLLRILSNDLTGPIPRELEKLSNLRELELFRNGLTGPIPPELGGLASIEKLDLRLNRLSGSIPPELGRLANLEELHLSGNNLTGTIPPELGELADLTSLRLGTNGLAGPIPAQLGSLSSLTSLGLAGNNFGSPIPPELGDLAKLQALNIAASGLVGSIPPELGRLTSLKSLHLHSNGLTGRIPSELGGLDSLTWLFLDYNKLDGPIPPELGELTGLTALWLSNNALTGQIPPELGNLSSLESLLLLNNELSDSIPAALGNLPALTSMWLQANELTGAIPPELGRLPKLVSLRLQFNNLTGPIPPELGTLTSLRGLDLHDNNLEGTPPGALGAISELQRLELSNNAELSGPLPDSFTYLRSLESLHAVGTDLCAPSDPDLQAWLADVIAQRIANCDGRREKAYLTQAVQSREFPVPLVAGRDALLRVFVTATKKTTEGIPGVIARFYRNGKETHAVTIPAKSTPIPVEVDESTLTKSANVTIPDSIVQPGLEMVIEIDPDGTLDDSLGVPKRIPDSGRLAVDVRRVPLFDLTIVPFLYSEDPDSSIIDLVDDMAEDPEGHEELDATRLFLPIDSFAVSAHAPVVTSTNNAHELLSETKLLHGMEGATHYYMGTMAGRVTGASGVAILGGKMSWLFTCRGGWGGSEAES